MNKKIIHTVFESTAEKYPAKTALRHDNITMSYSELNSTANQLAFLLKNLFINKGSTVAVLTSPGIALIQSVLAIFKCGGIYLPIDISQAEERTVQSFTDCLPEVVITDPENADQVKIMISDLGLAVNWLVICGPVKWELYKQKDNKFVPENINLRQFAKTNPELVSEPDDSNYIFYTSGSTGVAKAILGCNKGLGHFINWETEEFGITDACTVSLLSQFTFDASLRDIFLPLCNGGTLCIPSNDIKSNTLRLLEWIEESKISLIHCVPSLFRLMTKELENFAGKEKIRRQLAFILMAGEPLYGKDITGWRQVIGENTEIVNLYGTSETTLAKTFHRIKNLPSDPGQALHVGKPISHTVVAIFNDAALCGPGEIGEIFIKTPFMSKGYYKNEKLTNEIFVQNPLVKDRVDIMHRTGDFGRYAEDGNIEVLGRKDEQVKVNGIRVELGEIRKKVAVIKGIDEVEVMAHKNPNSENELVCYYSGEKYDSDVLKEKLKKTLNRAVTPAFFVYLEKFPLTINGKIDKKALPKPSALLIRDDEYEAPDGAMETRFEEMWIDILGLKRIGRHASFFMIGGSSLKAMQLISGIYKEYNVMIRINDVFAHQTIEKLAALVQSVTEKLEFSCIDPVPPAAYYDLSLAQKGVYLTCQSAKNLITFNIPLSYTLDGPLNKEAFQRAFETLVERHESLRTTFSMIQGMAKQKIHSPAAFNFSVSYSDIRDDRHKQETALNMADQQATTVFNLNTGPLIKASLVRLENEKHVFLLTMHHIISDGWSMEILIQEIITLYNAFNRQQNNPLLPLKIQYKDYVGWQQKQLAADLMNQSRNFWLSNFEEEIPLLQFPADFSRTGKSSFEGVTKNYVIKKSLVKEIKAACTGSGTTLFMFLLSAVNALVYRYTGRKDIVFGSPIAGRSHSDLENQVGLFVNMLMFRTKFQSGITFQELLTNVKNNALEAYNHSMYPFAQLVEDIDAVYGRNMNNFFDIAVQLQNAKFNKTKTLQFDGIKVDNFLPNSYSSKFELTFNFEDLEEEEEISLDIEYKTSLFKETTINKLKEDLFMLLEMVTKDQSLTLRQIRNELASKDDNQPMDLLGAVIEKGISTDY
jgi:mycobactin peptide synthetase MbtE